MMTRRARRLARLLLGYEADGSGRRPTPTEADLRADLARAADRRAANGRGPKE